LSRWYQVSLSWTRPRPTPRRNRQRTPRAVARKLNKPGRTHPKNALPRSPRFPERDECPWTYMDIFPVVGQSQINSNFARLVTGRTENLHRTTSIKETVSAGPSSFAIQQHSPTTLKTGIFLRPAPAICCGSRGLSKFLTPRPLSNVSSSTRHLLPGPLF
jgi:hypothetical protein